MDVDGDRLERALRRAHRCPPGCEACARAREAVREPPLERLLPLVLGDAGRRFAIAKAEYGIPIPTLCDDPLEQWLLEEALMARYAIERAEEERVEQLRTDARRQGEELLRREREGEGE